jgi:hypothetical protein
MTSSTNSAATAEVPVSRTKEEVVKEAKRIEEDALFSSKGHFAASQVWSNFHLILGIPAAVLAAVAGATAVADQTTVAAVISIVVAALTGVSTFVNPNERSGHHLQAGNDYDALRNRCRIFATIDCWGSEPDEVLTVNLKQLSEQKDKLNHSCPQIPWWAYRIAKRGIEAGEAVHTIDRAA